MHTKTASYGVNPVSHPQSKPACRWNPMVPQKNMLPRTPVACLLVLQLQGVASTSNWLNRSSPGCPKTSDACGNTLLLEGALLQAVPRPVMPAVIPCCWRVLLSKIQTQAMGTQATHM